MQKTYTGILRDVYYAPRRRFSVKGYRIETFDGVAEGVPEYPATVLLRQNIFSEIIPEFEENTEEETSVVSEVIETDSGEVVDGVSDEKEELQEEETLTEEEPIEEVEETTEEEEVVEDLMEEEPTEEHPEDDEEEVVDGLPEEPYMEFDSVEGNEETSDGLLTKSEVEELYERLGTWSAVAEDLDISTTTLRKYRDELGL